MIEVTNLTKNYGDKKALDNISFDVKKGEILGFLGPNGAGKSTAMNILTGFISYTSGTVKIDGTDILTDPVGAKRKIGYLPEQPPLYPDMTVYEYLEFVHELRKLDKKSADSDIRSVLDKINIGDVKGRRISNLSKGYKQRVGIAAALIGNPEIIILDEPTVGLDPNQIIDIRRVIKDLKNEHTVILSSHILTEISAVCDRVMIINKGKLIAEDTPQNLQNMLGKRNRVLITAQGEKERIEEIIAGMENISDIRYINSEGDIHEIELKSLEDIDTAFNRMLFFAFADKKIPILSHTQPKSTLEDIFLMVTGESEEENI